MTILTARSRPLWPDLPAEVRAAIESRLGASVTGWSSRDGGYTPGLASVLDTAVGPVFVKAVAARHEFSTTMYRQEAVRAPLLPAGVPAPRLRWMLEVDDPPAESWTVLAFDALVGEPAPTPLDDAALDAVARLCRQIGEHEASPALPWASDELPIGRTALLADELPAGLDRWDPWFARHLDVLATYEESAADAVDGPFLQHGDLRGDNVVMTAQGALAVDWPSASRGAAFRDLVGMLPAVRAEGGPAPEAVLAKHPLPPETDGDAVTAFLATLAGYFAWSSLQPPPPGIPHVRAFQRAQADVTVAWLRRRLGDRRVEVG